MERMKNNASADETSFLEKLFEKLLESSSTFKQLNESFFTIISKLAQLAETVIDLVQTVKAQQVAISELYELQDLALRRMKDLAGGPDIKSFPLREKKDEKLN
jgi:hypothetical protein